MKRLFEALSIYYIRIIPFVLMLVCLTHYIGIYFAHNIGNYYEIYDEIGILTSIQYDAPIFDSIYRHFAYSIPLLIPIYILSFRMRYCIYHRIPIYYLITNTILVKYFSDKLTTDNTLQYVTGGFILFGIAIILIVYSYLKYGDRKKSRHTK